MMDESLDPLDRATMATWRASNFLTWGGVALASALMLHTVGDEIAKRVHRFDVFSMNGRPVRGFTTWQFLAPQYGYRAFLAILTGVLIGEIVGRKALKAPAWTAGIVASVYVLISWLVLESSVRFISRTGAVDESPSVSGYGIERHGLPSGAREWSYSLVALFAVVVAPLVARFVAKRRNRGAVNPGTL